MDADVTAQGPSRAAGAERRYPIVGTSKRAREVLLAIGLVVLLVLAFYGGRAYQNNIDQKLFNAYSPATTGTRGSAFGGGGSGGAATGGSSLVNAALGVGTPPGSTSGAASKSGGASSNFGFGGNPGAGAAGAGASANRVSGTLASISPTSLSVTSFSGLSQSVSVDRGTHFYQSKTATAADLKPGSQVTILASGSGSSLTAVSISIGSQTVASGGGRFGGAGGGLAGGAPTSTIKGKIVHASASSITLSGRSAAIAMSGTTRFSRVVSIRASQLASGSFVSATLATVGGKMTATSVVARSGGFGASNRGG